MPSLIIQMRENHWKGSVALAGTNHFTPEEIAQKFGLDYEDVIRICCEEGVPIYEGHIDWTLFRIHAPQPAGRQLAAAAA